MKRPQLSVSLRPGLMKQIEDLKDKTGFSKSRIVEEAVERGMKQTEKILGKRGL